VRYVSVQPLLDKENDAIFVAGKQIGEPAVKLKPIGRTY